MARKTGIISYSKGSGKTTTCAYLAAALSTLHQKVVCVDVNGGLQKYLGSGQDSLDSGGIRWKYRRWLGEQDSLSDDADFVLVDMPSFPFVGQEKLMMELDAVLIPVEAEYYGCDELHLTLQKISEFDHLVLDGLILTKVTQESHSAVRVEEHLKEYFSYLVLNTKISRSYYLSQSRFSLNDLNGNGWHSGFADYLKLANELLEHEC